MNKKYQNLLTSLKILDDNGYTLEELSPYHYRIGDIDFWPSTGKFYHYVTGETGRGVDNFMALIKRLNSACSAH